MTALVFHPKRWRPSDTNPIDPGEHVEFCDTIPALDGIRTGRDYVWVTTVDGTHRVVTADLDELEVRAA